MGDFEGYMFDKNGKFHLDNLWDYGYHDVAGIKSGKRGYVGIWLSNRAGFKDFQRDVDNAIRFNKIYMGVDNVEDYMRSIVGDAVWTDVKNDFDMPRPYPDAIELRLCRKGGELVLLDTALRFSDAEMYPYDFTCRGCLDLQRFSENEKAALVGKALDAVYYSQGLTKDEILAGLVDWDIDKESTDDYYDGCLFSKNGKFRPKNITGVAELNAKSVDLLEASGPAQRDRFTVYFRGSQGFCWLEDDLDHGAKFGKVAIEDIGRYVDDAIAGDSTGRGSDDLPVPKPDYIAVDIGANNGALEILGSRLYFYDTDEYGVDLTRDDYLRLENFSEAEKQGIVDFAINTAIGWANLSKDDIKDRLVDRGSEYAKLRAVASKQVDDEDEFGDLGICDE